MTVSPPPPPAPGKPILVSHHLCPYVQRAAIALAEKRMPHERVYIDLAAKPDWFVAISPLGRVPLLRVGDAAIFESAVIVEYLEDVGPNPLHPADPLDRARHRAWIEFASACLNGIGTLYGAADDAAYDAVVVTLADRFARVEAALGEGRYFAGERFSLVDAAFAPVFRYFDVFDRLGRFGILEGKPRVDAWRRALAARPSVREAVAPDYAGRLTAFLQKRQSVVGRMAHVLA